MTSSLVNFVTSWQHSNKDKDKQGINISTVIAQMDMNDLMTLVASTVLCKFNMESLLQRLMFK